MEVSQAFLDSICVLQLKEGAEAVRLLGGQDRTCWLVRRLTEIGDYYEYLTDQGWKVWGLIAKFQPPHPTRYESLFDIPADLRDW